MPDARFSLAEVRGGDRAALLCTAIQFAWEHLDARSASISVLEEDRISPDHPLLEDGFELEQGHGWRIGWLSLWFRSTYLQATATNPARACELVRNRLEDSGLLEPDSIEVELEAGRETGGAKIVAELFLNEQIELETRDPMLIGVVIPALERRAAELGPTAG